MKKIIIVIFIFIHLITIISIVYADDEDSEGNDISWVYQEIESASAEINDEPVINSRAAVVYDRASGEVIWGKDENITRKMASTTKIMTAIVVLENINDMEEIVIVSNKSAEVGGSRLRIACTR